MAVPEWQSDEEILAKYPPPIVAAEVRRRFSSRSEKLWRPLWLLAPVAAAALVIVAVRAPEAPTEREKGMLAPHLLVHRRAASGPEQLGDHATARPGDVLQLSYVAAGRAYGLILSLDGRGQVTLHLPPDAPAAAPLAAQGTAVLPSAYELDDAPAFERFVFVTSRAPFEAKDIVDAARALAKDPSAARVEPLRLSDGLEQSSLVLEKKP